MSWKSEARIATTNRDEALLAKVAVECIHASRKASKKIEGRSRNLLKLFQG